MGFIRWMAHLDYVMRWSLWLHHPALMVMLMVIMYVIAVVVIAPLIVLWVRH